MELFDEIEVGAHERLCQKAVKWLMGPGKCSVAAMEVHAGCTETPDAIGFSYNGHCTLIECKVSRSDFFADRKKQFRANPQMGMGSRRYYLVPKGLISKEEIPEGWGLIYEYEKNCRMIKDSRGFYETNKLAELACAVRMLREKKYEFKYINYG